MRLINLTFTLYAFDKPNLQVHTENYLKDRKQRTKVNNGS